MGLFFLPKKGSSSKVFGGGEKWKMLRPRQVTAGPALTGFIKLLTASKFSDTVQLATLLTEKPRKDHFQVMGLGRGEAEGQRQGSSVMEERSQSVPILESVVFSRHW